MIIITSEIWVSYIIKLIIIYFRGFTYGVLLLSLMKINVLYLISITLIDAIFFLTILFFLSFRKKSSFNNTENIKIMMISIISVLIYSTLLELVGGKFG